MTERDLFPALTAACLFARERARALAAPKPAIRRRAVVRRMASGKAAALAAR